MDKAKFPVSKLVRLEVPILITIVFIEIIEFSTTNYQAKNQLLTNYKILIITISFIVSIVNNF